MTRLKVLWAEFLEDVQHCIEILDHAVHGRWDEGVVFIPEEVEQRAPEVRKGDITAEDLIAFMRSQGKPTGVFDAYIKTAKGGEQ